MKPEIRPEFRRSQALYRCLLLAYPRAHRAEYGAPMAQLFRDQCRDAWTESHHWGLAKLWLRTLPDWVSTCVLERLTALKERKSMTDKLANLFAFRATPLTTFFRVFVPVFLVVLILSVAITFLLPESYASTARIKVAEATDGGPYFIQTTFEIMQSQLVLNPVIEKLKLNVVWGKKYFNGKTLKSAETLKILKPRLEFKPVRNTQLVAITVYSDDRVEAAKIANAIAESYQNYRQTARTELVAKGLQVMQHEYQAQEGQIQQAQTEVVGLPISTPDAAASANSTKPVVEANPDANARPKLAQLVAFHKLLLAKIAELKLAAQMPKEPLVQIMDMAEPGHAPVRPNKPVNIAIGVLAGGFLGLAAGGAVAGLSFMFRQRRHQATSV